MSRRTFRIGTRGSRLALLSPVIASKMGDSTWGSFPLVLRPALSEAEGLSKGERSDDHPLVLSLSKQERVARPWADQIVLPSWLFSYFVAPVKTRMTILRSVIRPWPVERRIISAPAQALAGAF